MGNAITSENPPINEIKEIKSSSEQKIKKKFVNKRDSPSLPNAKEDEANGLELAQVSFLFLKIPSFLQSKFNLTHFFFFKKVEFESKLAEGTTSTVYKGVWSGIEVTIKQFREHGEKLEYMNELSILRKLETHPNIVSYLTCNDNQRFIVLEYIVNGTLHELLQVTSILILFSS